MLIVARLFGIAAVRLGQPRVMGEVIAGIALGPSLFGVLRPTCRRTLFSTDILPAFGVIANIGLIFYMFLIGLEVDQKPLRAESRQPRRSPTRASRCRCCSASPPRCRCTSSWARTSSSRRSRCSWAWRCRSPPSRCSRGSCRAADAEAPVGSLAIGCAAIDDVTAWFLIALATAITVSGSFGVVAQTIGEAVAFTLVMAFVVRRMLARMATAFDEAGQLPGGWFAAIVVGVLLSAYVTEAINIAVIFGGFIMGMVMPRHARLTEEVTRRIEDFVVTLLLPMFFVYTGLQHQRQLLDRPELWLITLGADRDRDRSASSPERRSRPACRGFNWRASAVIGTLMNTRGLTELIVLNLALKSARSRACCSRRS